MSSNDNPRVESVICATCGRALDWNIETETEISVSLCPDCSADAMVADFLMALEDLRAKRRGDGHE